MLARSATIFKWTLYTLAGLVWAVVQAAFLQRVTIWGVIPFLYPLIAALPATFEGPAAGHGLRPCLWRFLRPAAPLLHSLLLHLDSPPCGPRRRTAVPESDPSRVSLLCRRGPARLSADRHLPLHCPLGSGPSRMGCGHVRDPAGAVRLPAVEPAYDLAVPPGLSPRSC